MITRKHLEEFALLDSEISRIEKKLQYYKDNPVPSAHGIVKGSSRSYPYTESHFLVSGSDIKSDKERIEKVGQLIITLNENEKKYRERKIEIELFIESIEDVEMKQIIELKFIHGWTDLRIAKKMNYSRRAIGDKIDKLLKKFEQVQHCHNCH